MLEKSRLEELSAALPESERKEMLDRISKRMEREETEETVPVELAADEREKIISYEMKRAAWWVRFLIWLRTFFSGRSKVDVFLEIKLGLLKAKIRSVNPGLTGFETRDLTPKFARILYDMYAKVFPLIGAYQALTSDKALKAGAYGHYFESRYERARKSLDEFMSPEEMEEVYSQTGDTEEIRKKLGIRMNDYIRAAPESLFAQLEEQAKLHLYLGKLVLFPYAGLFRYFTYMLTDSLPSGYPVFEHAPVMLTLDLLEKLYGAVELVRRCAPEYLYAEEPLAYYLTALRGVRPEKEQDATLTEAELARLRAQVLDLTKEVEEFEKDVPLLEIIRFFRKDSYYNLMFNAPRLYLKSLYFSTLKGRIGEELEEKLATIRERVISKKIQDILKSQKLIELSYYRESLGFDFRKIGLPVFSHIRSINLTYNYLISQYKGTIQEAVQVVSATALANNRITQNRLMQNVSGLEDLEAKIILFDRSLSPEEDDGKQLARFRFNVSTDLILQKSYRAFVVQKDREARDHVEKARESLSGIKKIFDEIRTSTFENTRSLLKTLHMYKGKNQTLAQILNARSEGIGALLSLLDQLLEIEKGA
jgi:hypothetical protein